MSLFTLAQNETVFLRCWASYYMRHFSPEDLYILDHDSQGETVPLLEELARQGAHVIPVHHPQSYDSEWMVRLVRSFQQFLLASSSWVLFTGVDEIVTTSLGTDLREALESGVRGSGIVRLKGYEIFHYREQESPLVLHEPWLKQRRWWHHCARYSKPLLASLPVFWGPGFHVASNVPPYPHGMDEGLLLLHLHRIDYDVCVARHRERAAREWAPRERREGVYRHNLLEDVEQLSRWMLCDADNTGQYAKASIISPELRDLL